MIRNALVAGAGFMGSLKDSPNDDRIYTHGKAYKAHPGFNLVGFVDSDIERAMLASSRWGGLAYQTIDEAFDNHEIDVVSVATPDETHCEVLIDLAKRPIRHVFCEKPLVNTLDELEKVEKAFAKSKVKVTVNHTRRFLPQVLEVKSNIDRGIYGEYLYAVGHFGNGLIHDGCHMVDLMLYLVDTVENFHFHEINSKFYRIFELDMFFERARVRFTDFGWQIKVSSVKLSPFYHWQQHIVEDTVIPCAIDRAIYDALDHFESPTSTLKSAGRTLRECFRLSSMSER
jgi:predicted dehydrogenase